MDDKDLGELLFDGEHGVEARHGFLENDGDIVAADLVHLFVRDLGKILAVKDYLAAGNVAVSVKETQYAHRGDALAGAGLAHDTQSLAGTDGVGRVVDCLYHAALGGEIGVQIYNFK